MMNRHLSQSARAYIAASLIAAIAVAVLLVRWPLAGADLVTFGMITLLGAWAHAYPIQGFRHQAYQVTLPFIVLAAARFDGLQLVAFIIAIHLAEQARLRRPVHIQLFNACNYMLSASLSLTFFHHAVTLLPAGALGQLVAALASACSFIMLNRVLLLGVLWLARRLSPMSSGLFQPELLAADLIIAWIAGPMLVLAIEAGTWSVLVTAGPLLLARPALAAMLGRQREVGAGRMQAPAA
jgi:hypothetical protein